MYSLNFINFNIAQGFSYIIFTQFFLSQVFILQIRGISWEIEMSIFRNTVWFLKGLREYTASGYTAGIDQSEHSITLMMTVLTNQIAASANFNEAELDVDCKGKSYLITGCNSGIGKQTALEISKRGGTVHMVCRNPDTSGEAR